MIIHTVDRGWGPEWPIKQYEQSILTQYLAPVTRDVVPTVVINSTWYDDQTHQQTQELIRHSGAERLVLVSMIDSAIARRQRFQDLGIPVYEVGSYEGPHEIVFWALVLDRWAPRLDDHALIDTNQFEHAFMCLNRKPHPHRVMLYNQLTAKALLDANLVTMGSDDDRAQRTLPQDVVHQELSPNSGLRNHGIVNDNVSLGLMTNWQSHFLNVVTETVFDVNRQWFVSEKIFKPVIGLRPFVVYSMDGAQAWLEHHGFLSYADDFQDITDLTPRDPTHMADFLAVVHAQGLTYWKKKYLDLLPKILYNRQVFHDLVTQTKTKIKQGFSCQT